MPDGKNLYPLEVVVSGVPISLQSKSSRNRDAWKRRVSGAARTRRRETYELGFLDDRSLAVTIYYFPRESMVGDVDNIVKPIMDAMIGIALIGLSSE
jgi:Holliday junction resolvase RusA-like endonuclease